MKISLDGKNAQLSERDRTRHKRRKNLLDLQKSKQCLDNSGERSTRADIEFRCGCDICQEARPEELIVVYFLRLGKNNWVTERPEHVCAFSEFIQLPVLIWTRIMARSEYLAIPEFSQ